MRRVTLTFDNGPSADTTPFVLDELKQRNIEAYFCLVGSQLQAADAHVDIAKEALGLGHRLANHSLSHGIALGDKPTELHARREVFEMHQLMNEKLGDWGSKWFRPFGRGGQVGPHLFSESALDQLRDLEYSVLLWNCVPRDWVDTGGWVETALEQIEQSDHAVVVLHDLATGAMKHLPRFLDVLQSLDVELTLDLPDDCVLLNKGALAIPVAEMNKLTSAG